MPIEIKYKDDGVGIEFVCSGCINGADIIEANKKIYSNENFPKQKYKIADRTNCTDYKVGSKEIRIIAEQDRNAAKINPNFLVVLISGTDLQYGMSRVYHAQSGDRGFHIEIFHDRKSAEDWIKKQLQIP